MQKNVLTKTTIQFTSFINQYPASTYFGWKDL